jgi:hypothetical protein
MKNMKIKSIFALLVVTLLFSGCAKDKNEPSKVTFWPILTVTGDKLVIITEGDVYTDAGAVATSNGVPIDVKVTNQVDASTAGVYPVKYEAFNDDGIPAIDSRTIIVLPAATTLIDGDHIVGDFTLSAPARPSPVPSMSVTKLATGLYKISNIYGSNGSNSVIQVPAFVYTTDGLVYNILDATLIGDVEGTEISSGGTATWNPITSKLACAFKIASVGPTLFSRTWQHN